MRDLRRATILLHSFFGLQILLGGAAWWAVAGAAMRVSQPTVPYVTLTVAHVLGGALTLAAAVIFTLTCFRLIPSAAAVGADSAAVNAVARKGRGLGGMNEARANTILGIRTAVGVCRR